MTIAILLCRWVGSYPRFDTSQCLHLQVKGFSFTVWKTKYGAISNPGGGKIFRTGPDRPWGPLSLLYNGYRIFPGAKAAGAWRWPSTPFSAEVKDRLELYLYVPSRPLWSVLGWSLPLPLPYLPNGTALQPKRTTTPSSKIWGAVRGKDLKSRSQEGRHPVDIWPQNFLVSRTSLHLRVTSCHCIS